MRTLLIRIVNNYKASWLVDQKKAITQEKRLTPTGLAQDTSMAKRHVKLKVY